MRSVEPQYQSCVLCGKPCTLGARKCRECYTTELRKAEAKAVKEVELKEKIQVIISAEAADRIALEAAIKRISKGDVVSELAIAHLRPLPRENPPSAA